MKNENVADWIIDANRDFDILAEALNNDKTPADITGWTLYFTVKESLTDTDANAKILLTFTSLSDPTHGLALLSIPAASIALLTNENYFYEVTACTGGGKNYTLGKGKLIVDETVKD